MSQEDWRGWRFVRPSHKDMGFYRALKVLLWGNVSSLEQSGFKTFPVVAGSTVKSCLMAFFLVQKTEEKWLLPNLAKIGCHCFREFNPRAWRTEPRLQRITPYHRRISCFWLISLFGHPLSSWLASAVSHGWDADGVSLMSPSNFSITSTGQPWSNWNSSTSLGSYEIICSACSGDAKGRAERRTPAVFHQIRSCLLDTSP